MAKTNMKTTRKQRLIGLPGLKATSCLTVVLLIFLETVLLSTVSNCAKTFFMHWNTSNSIFRIDNTDHIIDVNKGNLAFEYDQVHIICPVYEQGTFDNETEKYIIYNVSKVEYETCRITNANPRIIAICDKPQKLMYFTITFRPFTPQPGGLEFLPGNDYYFISTSSKDDLHRRIGGRCSTNNMKVVFKVCCAPETETQNATQTSLDIAPKTNSTTTIMGNATGERTPSLTINTSNAVKSTMTWLPRENDGNSGYRHSNPITSTISVQQYHPHPTSSRPSSINSAINNSKFKNNNNNNNNNNNKNFNNNNFNHSNNAPSHKPTKKTSEYDKHPNEVVKNEELTYNNNAGSSLMRANRRSADNYTSFLFSWMPQQLSFIVLTLSLVFFLNYTFVIQSMFVPNLIHIVRCKVPAGANNITTDESDATADDTVDADNSTKMSSKMCQLASSQCQLTNVPRADVDDSNVTTKTSWNEKISNTEDSQLAHASTMLIQQQCCLASRTTATASVKLIDKAMPPQLIPQQRSIVTTNFNDNTTTTPSPNNILNNTNTVLNYSKSTFVHSHLYRTYDEAKGTINLTKNAFIALYTTNSDNIKLNISSDKFSLNNDSCIRHNSIECSGYLQQHQQQHHHQQRQHSQHSQHKQHYYNLNSISSGDRLVQCFR
ncbi:hybrid signal transduction histidine kinase E [Contarinia nasturtii]|uniref:hybrid signal transduction histidine kinase E n=1 Tax=Contarinia nasturtii TaxID=265458 RepID=UPI0012D45FDD|nr:hybrid signal transduction histidine kinase E [Contarinia nasturtii]XP_031640108.1 hybrid signal transduction histidine kinase E [Contarinia nasturtii]XP_031640109.1 hybrid signal transduction histidine kinase E [Contarinia nasturtii]